MFNSSTWILKVQVYGIQLFMGSSISKTSTKTSIFSDPSWERGLRGCQEVRPARAGAQNDQGWGDHVKPDLLSKCLPFLLLLFSGERISFPRDAIADRLFRVGGGECGASKAGSHNMLQPGRNWDIIFATRCRACEAPRWSLRERSTRSATCKRKLKSSTRRLVMFESINEEACLWMFCSLMCWPQPGGGADQPEEDCGEAAGRGARVVASRARAEVPKVIEDV